MLISAEAMPFELFENVKTNQEAQEVSAKAGGRGRSSYAGGRLEDMVGSLFSSFHMFSVVFTPSHWDMVGLAGDYFKRGVARLSCVRVSVHRREGVNAGALVTRAIRIPGCLGKLTGAQILCALLCLVPHSSVLQCSLPEPPMLQASCAGG